MNYCLKRTRKSVCDLCVFSLSCVSYASLCPSCVPCLCDLSCAPCPSSASSLSCASCDGGRSVHCDSCHFAVADEKIINNYRGLFS